MQLARVQAQTDGYTVEYPAAALPIRRSLEWLQADIPPAHELVDLTRARIELEATVIDYLTRPDDPDHWLVVRAQPGLGKTWVGVKAAQTLADLGQRVLYAMPQHSHWGVLGQLPNFNPAQWYHWQATTALTENPPETMCRESAVTTNLMRKGWPLSLACQSICAQWQTSCAYRAQRRVKQRVIAGVHEHVVYGLPFDVQAVIVDEEPRRAFLRERHVKAGEFATSPRGGGCVGDLLRAMSALAGNADMIAGRKLLDVLGPILTRVYQEVRAESLLPLLTAAITSRHDLEALPAWIAPDLIRVLVPEWEAWRRGRPVWLERVQVGKGGAVMLARSDLWGKLPPRMVILDATAHLDIYAALFPGKTLRMYEPRVEHRGSVTQVAGRYWGVGRTKLREANPVQEPRQTADPDRPGDVDQTAETDDLTELIDLCAALIDRHQSKQPGIVTFKRWRARFEALVGAGRVAHFGGQRGSNSLEGCDLGVVVGTYSPPDGAMMRVAAALHPNRLDPFVATLLPNGCALPIRTERLVAYPFVRAHDGLTPHRWLTGLWEDHDLHAVMASAREAELVQAVHRFRILTNSTPVYLISPVPVNVPLHDVCNSIELGPPEIPTRAWLRLLPWLDHQETITPETLATRTGYAVGVVRRGAWLRAIMNHQPDRWEIEAIKRAGPGRPGSALKHARGG